MQRLAQAGCSHDLVTLGVPLPELGGLKFQFASVLPPSLLAGPNPGVSVVGCLGAGGSQPVCVSCSPAPRCCCH